MRDGSEKIKVPGFDHVGFMEKATLNFLTDRCDHSSGVDPYTESIIPYFFVLSGFSPRPGVT